MSAMQGMATKYLIKVVFCCSLLCVVVGFILRNESDRGLLLFCVTNNSCRMVDVISSIKCKHCTVLALLLETTREKQQRSAE